MSESILEKSNQYWKFRLFFVGLIFSFIGMSSGLYLMMQQRIFFWLVVASLIAAVVIFFAACLLIKCPNCNAKWLWLSVTKNDPPGGMIWLFTESHCPMCKKGSFNRH